MFGSVTRAGATSLRNQDRCVMWSHPTDGDRLERVVGMFDGHGAMGEMAAHVAAHLLLDRCATSAKRGAAEWGEFLRDYFRAAHDAIRVSFISLLGGTYAMAGGNYAMAGGTYAMAGGNYAMAGGNYAMAGGTTATVCVVVDGCVVTASVGDSDALIVGGTINAASGYYSSGGVETGGVETGGAATGTSAGAGYLRLTADHRPTNVDEWRRIQAHPMPRLTCVYETPGLAMEIFAADGSLCPVEGAALYKNARDEFSAYCVLPPQLRKPAAHMFGDAAIAMTRSLGDFAAHGLGLTCEPDVSVTRLADLADPAGANLPPPYSLAVGTDGIFDCWRYEEFADAARARVSLGGMIEESDRRARREFGGLHDDATLCLIELDM